MKKIIPLTKILSMIITTVIVVCVFFVFQSEPGTLSTDQ